MLLLLREILSLDITAMQATGDKALSLYSAAQLKVWLHFCL